MAKDILAEGTVIAGMGLMGSSFARAIRDMNPSYRICGLDSDPVPIEKGIRDMVLADGTVLGTDEKKTRQLLAGAGFVILSMYPDGILDFIRTYRDAFRSGAVVIDICGLKGGLVEQAQALMPEDCEYVATHPMAGKEKSGYENGDGEMFFGASFLMTPTEKNRPETLDSLRLMARRMGFGKIREVSPDRHDAIIAYTSHLPHVIASSLVASWDGDEDIVSYGGGSLRDATRVAEMNSDMWTELFTRNQKELLKSLDQYIDTLEAFREMLADLKTVEMTAFLDAASDRKKDWNRKVDHYDGG